MPSALSSDLRSRIVVAIEAGASRREAARRFEVSPASAVRWHETFVREGRTQAKPMGGDQGTVRNFVWGRPVEHQAAMARVKRSPKMMANCALAMTHSRGPIFHAFSERFKTR